MEKFIRLEFSEKQNCFHFAWHDERAKPNSNSFITIQEFVKYDDANKFTEYINHVFDDIEWTDQLIQNEWNWYVQTFKIIAVK